jgi:hypothetical protein
VRLSVEKCLFSGLFVVVACASSESSDSACPNTNPNCPPSEPSYATSIAPIITASCLPCHAAGGVASDRLLTDYESVYRIRSTVLTQVYGCLMPPPLTPQELSSSDKKIVLEWLACNAPNN